MRTKKDEKFKLESVEELLGVVNEESAMDIEISKIQPFRAHEVGIEGAATLFYPELMEKLSDQFGDYFILPSSIHEEVNAYQEEILKESDKMVRYRVERMPTRTL